MRPFSADVLTCVDAPVSYEITAVAELFIAVEAITLVLLHAVMDVLHVDIQVGGLVEGLSADFAHFAFDLRVSAFVRLQLRSGFEGFVAKAAGVIFDSRMDLQMNFEVAGGAKELRTAFARERLDRNEREYRERSKLLKSFSYLLLGVTSHMKVQVGN